MAKAPHDAPQIATWIAELAQIDDAAERAAFLEDSEATSSPEIQERLNREILTLARQDLKQAERLALASRWIAEQTGDERGLALSTKSQGNLRYVAGRFEEALAKYDEAASRFRALGAEVDEAITLSSSLQSYILLGRYQEALQEAQRARTLLERHDETLLLARLDSNQANIFLRQGRLAKAAHQYERVLVIFRERGGPQDLAVALSNLAVCQIGLSEFPEALATYRELSAHCRRFDIALVAAQADYNIAYLYFLRGEYMRSLELYRQTRERCRQLGDPYHQALCDLDQAEIHLELNLVDEGDHLAASALGEFEKLGNSYEAAKAVTFRAIAAGRRREAQPSLALFRQARERFDAEGNSVWLAMIDLYRALILEEAEDYAEASRLTSSALALFSQFHQVSKAILCELLLARIDLALGDPETALRRGSAALERLEPLDAPASTYQAYFVLGQAEESLGRFRRARAIYGRAHQLLENLRSHLRGEELKIAFLKDKQDIYESLVWITIRSGLTLENQRSAFLYIEQAKSRILADLIAFRADALPPTSDTHRELAASLHHQRDELNWTYRQLDLYELERAAVAAEKHSSSESRRLPSPKDTKRNLKLQAKSSKIADLRRRSARQERRLLDTLNELRSKDAELVSLQGAGSLDLEAIRAAIPDQTVLVEYFEARGSLFVGLLNQQLLEVRELGGVEILREHQRFLQLQLAKFELTADYLNVFGTAIYRTMLEHLGGLYQELIAPIRDRLNVERLIFVPHGPLHYVPFHALWDEESFLLDHWTISYAPSASVFAMCSSKPTIESGSSLIFGVPDELTPHIRGEVEAVAEMLPDGQLFLGEEATEERLRDLGRHSRLLHLATHGIFRRDNPMFSAIQLGTSRLTLFDLYQLRLESELVVLSGCATGVNVVESGDELIGLTRGLLYAGARSTLVTLWNVHDESTALFMKALYRHLRTHRDRALAVRHAMQEVRETHPNPFFWAPFVLIGNPVATG